MSDDVNATVAAALQDLSAVQPSTHRERAFARAARAIFSLDRPLADLRDAHGALPRIAAVGPSSLRVILEVLDTGRSETVDRAIADRGAGAEVDRRRRLRDRFLSRAAVIEALRGRGALASGDYRADLQMHSTWSDGSESIAELAAAAIGRGCTHLAITDHSHGLPIARGMSPEAAAAQHREIDRLNDVLAGAFRVIKGVEANLLGDGTLDLSADECRRFELVLAAPHSQLRMAEDQTARLLAAVAAPAVAVLAHPRGRKYGARAGITADWDRVFAAAAAAGVAVEIDGDPYRQDLDFELARRALAAGCLFALDSDAHASSELVYAETAIAHARLASIPADRVLNCWPLDRLLDWLATRRT
jgi:histidinol phosphatase-like PHP family hydrolase